MGDLYVEERYEFDAPRFYDFVEGTPEGSNDNTGDRWFETSATKGLATPLGPKPADKPPQQQADAAEAKVVRTALAHITNNTAAAQQGAKAGGHKQAAPSGHHKAAAKGAARQKQQTNAAEQPAPAAAPAGAAAAECAAGRDADAAGPPVALPAEPAGKAMEVDEQGAKRRRTHSMATRSMAPGDGGAQDEPGGEAKTGAAAATLTVPKSPRLVTKKRSRPPRFKPREALEEEEMAAMPKFKARPLKKHILLDKSGMLGVHPVPHKPPTEPQPFHLATDERAAVHQASSGAAAEGAVFVFQAEGGGGRAARGKKKGAGGAASTNGAAKRQGAAVGEDGGEGQPQRGKRRRTSGPPQLATDARGQRAQEVAEQQRQAEVKKLKQQAEFKALPLNKAALAHPFRPAPSNAELTIPDNVVLASDARARERMQFDAAIALKQQLEEEERAAEEERRRKEEEREVRKYRKGLQFKAKPLPADIYGRHDELS